MNKHSRDIVHFSIALSLVFVLGSCSGLADMMGLKNGKDGAPGTTGTPGATGAPGAEGPSVYLVADNGDTAQGLRIYSGGSVYLGQRISDDLTSIKTTFTIVNKSGHELSFDGASPKVAEDNYYLYSNSGYLYSRDGFGAADETGLGDTLAPEGTSGASFSISFPYLSYEGIYHKNYQLYLRDTTTGETFTLSFEVTALSGVLYSAPQ